MDVDRNKIVKIILENQYLRIQKHITIICILVLCTYQILCILSCHPFINENITYKRYKDVKNNCAC